MKYETPVMWRVWHCIALLLFCLFCHHHLVTNNLQQQRSRQQSWQYLIIKILDDINIWWSQFLIISISDGHNFCLSQYLIITILDNHNICLSQLFYKINVWQYLIIRILYNHNESYSNIWWSKVLLSLFYFFLTISNDVRQCESKRGKKHV